MLSITQHWHLLAWEEKGWRKAEVGSVPELHHQLLLSSGAEMPREGDIPPLTHLGGLGLSFPIYKIGALGLSISKGPSSRALLEFKLHTGSEWSGGRRWFSNGIS